jgi:hypothetical protein
MSAGIRETSVYRFGFRARFKPGTFHIQESSVRSSLDCWVSLSDVKRFYNDVYPFSSLKPRGDFMYYLLLHPKNIIFCAHSVPVCSVWFSQ